MYSTWIYLIKLPHLAYIYQFIIDQVQSNILVQLTNKLGVAQPGKIENNKFFRSL